MHDAPAKDIEHVYVTIERVEVRREVDGADDETPVESARNDRPRRGGGGDDDDGFVAEPTAHRAVVRETPVGSVGGERGAAAECGREEEGGDSEDSIAHEQLLPSSFVPNSSRRTCLRTSR
jgi:hypothetical protein